MAGFVYHSTGIFFLIQSITRLLYLFLNFHCKRWVLLVCFLISWLSVDAQKIEGRYFHERDSFAQKVVENYSSDIEVENPCSFGYCIFTNRKTYEKGVIDSNGTIVFKGDNKNRAVRFFRTETQVYLLVTLWPEKGFKLVGLGNNSRYESDGRSIQFFSTIKGADVFFIEKQRKDFKDDRSVTGFFLAIRGEKADTFSETGNFFCHSYSSFINGDRFPVIKFNGYIIGADKYNYLHFMDFQLNPLWGSLKLLYHSLTDTPYIITVSGNQYIFLKYNREWRGIDTFEKCSFNSPLSEDFKFKKNGKWGAYVQINKFESERSYARYLYIPPVFDTFLQLNNRYEIKAMKGDTLFTYQNYGSNEFSAFDTLRYRKDFYEVSITKNGKTKMLGSYGTMYRENKGPFRLSDLMPYSAFVGLHFQLGDYKDRFTKDTFSMGSMNIEAGVGWYEMEIDGSPLFSTWYISGFGFGLEYRIPMIAQSKLESRTGYNYRPLFFNARAEMGGGVMFLFVPISIHLQIGYTTDFLHHYIRPGIGINILNLQLGIDTHLLLSRNFPGMNNFGLYARYIFTESY